MTSVDMKMFLREYGRWMLAISGLIFVSAVLAGSSLFMPLRAGEIQRINIPRGSTAAQIAQQLESSGLIRSGLAFRVTARITGQADSLQAGTYDLSPQVPIREMVDIISRGAVVNTAIRITIPEGATLPQMGEIFAGHGLFSSAEFLQAAANHPLPAELTPAIPPNVMHRLEGYLFPDTYDFAPNATPQVVISAMLTRFAQVALPLVAQSPQSASYNLHQIVTMASIVEREAVRPEERPRIAGVFYNRLERNMLLQSCATVNFAIGRSGPLLYADLEVDSPYNTYRHLGLPPGPIASPGLAALRAAVAPENTTYLFFVARADGSHIFSRTFAEHQRAIRLAQQR